MIFDKRFLKYNFTNTELNLLKNKKILITGASGFIGYSLYLFLQNLNKKYKLNIKFYLLSRNKITHKRIDKSNTKHLKLNVTDFSLIKFKVNIIFHLASNVEHQPSRNVISESLNTVVTGTNKVVEYCKKYKVSKLIFFSSAAIYSNKNNLIKNKINEDYDMYFNINDKFNYYAIHKKIAEDLIINNLKKNNYYIIRPFTIVGPRMKLNHSFVFGNFIKCLLDKKNIVINGNGLAKRSFLHVDDLSYFSLKIALSGVNQIYNLGSDQIISIKKLANYFVTLAKKEYSLNLKIKILNNISKTRRQEYKPDIQLFVNEFKLKENFTINNKIIDTYNWFK